MKTQISFLLIISVFFNSVVTQSVSVNDGYSLTLHTNTEIQSKDVIEWRYGFDNVLVAKLNRETNAISYSDPDGRFSDRLKLNNQTGDLTITDVTRVIGKYHLKITGDRITAKTFDVSGQGGFASTVTSFLMTEGDSVELDAGTPDFSNYDVIRWMFQHSLLAEINRKTEILSTYDDVHDGRFRDNVHVESLTGDLTVTNITNQHAGLYEVNVISNSRTHTIHKSFTITVSGVVKSVSVMAGDSVTLNTDDTDDIQTDDYMDWSFGPKDTNIASFYKATNRAQIYDYVLDGIFRNTLDVKDGSLSLQNITIHHSGLYQVKIRNRSRSIHRKFILTVTEARDSSGVTAGICVGVLLVIAAVVAGVFYYRHRFPKATTQEGTSRGTDSQEINLPLKGEAQQP